MNLYNFFKGVAGIFKRAISTFVAFLGRVSGSLSGKKAKRKPTGKSGKRGWQGRRSGEQNWRNSSSRKSKFNKQGSGSAFSSGTGSGVRSGVRSKKKKGRKSKPISVHIKRRIIVFGVFPILLVGTIISVVIGVQTAIDNIQKGADTKNTVAADVSGVFQNCTKDNLSLNLIASPNAVSGSTTFTKQAVHKGDVPCTVDMGGKGLQVEVFSGDKVFFTTSACDDSSRKVLIGLQDSVTQELQWNANLTCSAGRLPSGQYEARLKTEDGAVVSGNIPVTVL
jgi:hypothetical protein